MVEHIVNFEARRDRQDRVRVYKLDPDDGGGSFEVAGVNDRYHPKMARELRALVNAGKYMEAEAQAIIYIAGKTDFPASIASDNAIRFLLRDIAWNRGPTGAVRTLQLALNVPVDGKIGPVTRKALNDAEANPEDLILGIRTARDTYERQWAGRKPGNRYWKGLVNRWNKASAIAQEYL